jgi:flavin reductase (DIM6/NTAB) family NADH-FMN oxidoreductase RutF
MKHFSLQEIQQWERFYRAHFINSLSGFKSASLIGTVDEHGQENLGLFSNIVHLGADPALIGFINRPKEAAPHTIANIEATSAYTINLFTEALVQQAHQTSAKYAKDQSEFVATGLTPAYTEFSKAPFVEESPVKYALELKEIVPIQHNGTWLVIGAVTHVLLHENLLASDGFIQLENAGIVTSLGIDAYYKASPIVRLPYAKP